MSIGGKARRRLSSILHGGKDKDRDARRANTPPPSAPTPPVPAIPIEHVQPTTLTDEPVAIAASQPPEPSSSATPDVTALYLDSDSDSDAEQFYTPTDGLSEVAEEDEAQDTDVALDGADDKSVRRAQVSASPSVLASHIHHRPRGATPIDQSAFLRDDIAVCAQAVGLFLTSRMKEAETLVYESDPEAQHMYVQNAGAVIQAIKGMMTFDQEDLSVALEISKGTSALADSLRKPGGGIGSKLAGLVRSNAVDNIRSMTIVQKHAELVYAESLLLKAVLGIVAGGSWVGLINEALNMRSAYGIYRTLQQYLEASGGDTELDEDFKSGVELGTGLSSLMLSLLPGKVLKVGSPLPRHHRVLIGGLLAGRRDIRLHRRPSRRARHADGGRRMVRVERRARHLGRGGRRPTTNLRHGIAHIPPRHFGSNTRVRRERATSQKYPRVQSTAISQRHILPLLSITALHHSRPAGKGECDFAVGAGLATRISAIAAHLLVRHGRQQLDDVQHSPGQELLQDPCRRELMEQGDI